MSFSYNSSKEELLLLFSPYSIDRLVVGRQGVEGVGGIGQGARHNINLLFQVLRGHRFDLVHGIHAKYSVGRLHSK